MSDTFLSIIIPCYNVAEYLPKTIQSLEQLHNAEDVEFIFINDGSPDDSLSHIKSFQAKDNRVKLINQENAGVSSARNNAIALVEGEYLTLLDGDDYLAPEAIDIIRTSMHGSDAMLPNITRVTGKKLTYCSNKIAPGIYSPNELFTNIKIFPTAPQLIYRTSIVRDNKIKFDTMLRCGEVYDFTIHFLLHANSVSVVDKSFYYYVMHPDSAVHKPNFQADLTVLHLLENLHCIDRQDAHWTDSPSFYNTAFKLATSFTYNKYIRHMIKGKEVLQTIKCLVNNQYYRALLHKTAASTHAPLQESILSTYILVMPTLWGYSLLSNTYKITRLMRLFSKK